MKISMYNLRKICIQDGCVFVMLTECDVISLQTLETFCVADIVKPLISCVVTMHFTLFVHITLQLQIHTLEFARKSMNITVEITKNINNNNNNRKKKKKKKKKKVAA